MKFYRAEYVEIPMTSIGSRMFTTHEDVEIILHTSEGILKYRVKKGFNFDARSGGKIVDFFVPWTGDWKIILAWFIHDLNFYGHLSFELSNELLEQMLRWAGLGWRAGVVKSAVDRFGRSSYTDWGVIPKEKIYALNMDKMQLVQWSPI